MWVETFLVSYDVNEESGQNNKLWTQIAKSVQPKETRGGTYWWWWLTGKPRRTWTPSTSANRKRGKGSLLLGYNDKIEAVSLGTLRHSTGECPSEFKMRELKIRLCLFLGWLNKPAGAEIFQTTGSMVHPQVLGEWEETGERLMHFFLPFSCLWHRGSTAACRKAALLKSAEHTASCKKCHSVRFKQEKTN